MIIFIIVFILISFISLYFFIRHKIFNNYVLKQFKTCNVLVGGKKGKGKDLLFQWVINKRKRETYYSNISYGGKGQVITLKQVSCEPNDYNHIVNDKIEKQEHKFIDRCDIYISDIGIFLPSYMDSKLYVQFPSMPVFYSLSRHLYNCNVHCNSQNIERGWKALREQADFYIIVRGSFKIFGRMFTKITTYENYESAKANLRPLKARMLNKYSKAEVDIYNAKSGVIKEGYIIQKIKDLHYDTRAFEKILLKGNRLEEKNIVDDEITNEEKKVD